jgi:ankyrin repeat protein
MARDNGATPLFVAAQFGYETVVRALIEMGADVNKAMHVGATPLYSAAQEGHAAIVQILRDAGAA